MGQTTTIRHTTYWKCNRCGRTGGVQYPEGESVYTVLAQLEDDHNAAMVNGCHFDVSEVQVSPDPFGE